MLTTFLCGVILISQVLCEEVFLSIPNGKIKGRKEISARNVTFYAFQQIPYGKSPIGKLRFKAPEPVENWDGVLDATVNNKVCYQVKIPYFKWKSIIPMETEDCLYVNVYTPVLPNNESSLPVMYFIYGGGFILGNALYAKNGPHYFMEQDVVIVTVNYRVGPFGFLSTGDTIIPGNYGLKDQNLGLKWVRNNIRYFGGDPDKVTIFGHSAGGASVTFHMISEESEGLFRGAIAESGSALCPWAYQRHHKEIAYKLASFIDSNFSANSTSEQLLEFLQHATSKQIADNSVRFQETVGHKQMVQGFWYTPVIEPQHDTAFITEAMYASIANGVAKKVPLMIGICSEEQLSKASNIDSFKNEVIQSENDIALLVNENMHLTDDETKTSAGKAIRKIYTDGLLVNDLASAVKYFSDVSFSIPIIHHAYLQSQFSDVYFYQFSYHGTLGGNNVYVKGAGRVTHAEETVYLWAKNNNSNLDTQDPNDVLTSRRYLTLHTNFAKTLNPTPTQSSLLQNLTWPKVTQEDFKYLDIDSNLEIKTNPKGEAYARWLEVYQQFAVKPYDTF